MGSYAVIDMGTNSIRLLLAEIDASGRIVESKSALEMTRLGKGVDKTRNLSQESMDATVEALKQYKAMAEAFLVEKIHIIATSAVRDANNRDMFLRRVKEDVGLEIDVISGDEEARLGFLGVLGGTENTEGDLLVIDIGGGSTEFIVGNSDGIHYSVSKDVGAVRMTDKHLSKRYVASSERLMLVDDITSILETTMADLENQTVNHVIGIGGTITTLAAMVHKVAVYDPEKIHNTVITLEEIKYWVGKLEVMTLEERKEIVGLQPKRADIIYAGGMILLNSMEQLGLKSIKISDYDNLEGCLFDRL